MRYLTTVLVALVAGFAGAAAFTYSGLGDANTREYLVSNPDILPEMANAYQTQEARQQLASIKGNVSRPFEGAVLGNPNGSKTLVKFTDYACGYCRATVADVDRLIAADPDLRVVVREWPIFNGSEVSARMGLAAAKQGKYDAFYHALFALGTPTAENVAAAARTAGVDMDVARTYGESDEVTAELARNDAMARQLGFTGTPSWVVGDQVFEGAVGYDRLAQYIEDAEG
ncbi:DsbA family protein [Qipengyuania sp. 1NDH17]|uniref:DsbA family protein n=2 Tax=Qipengyuania polymorpha TaxID=2867234 RepID=A0ABS7J2E2_9SPHN|nr:DsbA family protein [Qipengyuania polymorpha]